MARNPQDINPEDTFPRRNLPDEAEKWGRSMEDRVVALEKAMVGQAGSIQGTNRNLAAQLSNLSDQLNSVVFPTSDTVSGAGFDVPPLISSRACGLTIDIPLGFTSASLICFGYLCAKNQSASPDYLHGVVYVNGVSGGVLASEIAPVNSFAVVYPSNAVLLTGLVPGEEITVNLNVKGQANDWGTYVSNFARLGVLIIFSR